MKPKVSVIITTYNHENYIERCINSVLIQKVNFELEVLVGEDCSTDDTRKVLRKMEPNLPEYFSIFYRERNMGLGVGGNGDDLEYRAKGEYVIFLEGDDYWLYDLKLQKQVDFLDEHPDYVAVSHKCVVVNENSAPVNEEYPDCKKNEYLFADYLKGILPGQLATILYRNRLIDVYKKFDLTRTYNRYPIGDRKLAFLLLTEGKVKCLPDKWSAYRHVTTSGSSFSATYFRSDELRTEEVKFYQSLYLYAKAQHNRDAIVVSGKLYYGYYFSKCFGKRKLFNISSFIKEIVKEQFGFSFFCFAARKSAMLFVNKLIEKISRKK